jgi:hypothetical protein
MDIRNCIVSLLGLVATESAIFRYLLDGREYEVRKEFTDREVAAPAAAAPGAAPAADPGSNVVPIQQHTWGVHTAPRQHIGDAPFGWVGR